MSTTTAAGGAAASDPYITPDPYTAPNTGTFTGTPGTGVFEITLTTSLATAASPAASQIVSGTTNIHAETYNGAIPGPTFRLTVGDTVIVRLVNNLPYPTGIHWHGIELANSADGTEVTQSAAIAAFTPPPAPAPAGGTYLYKFKVTRPGIFWYHPHHHNSTNRVFRGLYGMIIVTDPNETMLVGNTLPSALDTKQLVLSDITVCKAPGMNDTTTYPTPAGTEWLASTPTVQAGATPTDPQPGPTPQTLCAFTPPGPGPAVDDDGMPVTVALYGAGDVPSLMAMSGRINEGQTVLTNGVNVGGRAGSPSVPGAVAPSAYKLPVRRGQGLRLQIVNCATTRYFRLRLTDSAGQKVDLVRVGGEGGLLDNAVLEGGVISGFDTKYDSGEILLPPSVRADVVAAIPDSLAAGSVLTLWTRDFQRLGPGAAGGGPWAKLPTVPVMHLEVTADPADSPAYAIVGGVNGVGGTPLRAKVGFPGPLVDTLGAANATLLTPLGGFVAPKFGMSNQDIELTSGTPSINGVDGSDLMGHMMGGVHVSHIPYTSTPHIGSSRYAEKGRILELTVTNSSDAHHPFHLHGFSMQPLTLTRTANPTFTWGYREFRDSIDVPANYTLTFRVRLDDRPLVDGVTLGGWLGRWLFHCHIFFHHHRGMIGEFVVTDANVKERPYVDVGGSWAYAGASAPQRRGTFSSPEGNPMTLAATYGAPGAPALIATAAPVVTLAPVGTTPGTWSWTYPGGIGVGIYYVYITATDTVTLLQGQAVFRLKIGGADDGADIGDPHMHTVDGRSYDFQAVGEFTLLRDREDGLEIQARQTPVETANPITDSYSGLTSDVSVNTAVAARVGSHRISYQPSGGEGNSRLQFFLDGKPAELSTAGIDLEGHRVSAFDADGETGLRVDYAHGAVLTVAPRLWHIWILDIRVSHTQADEGIMGSIPEQTWLPTLPSGATVGPMPKELHDRYIALYKTFADAWRVTDKTSLFVYMRGTSTETFTDKDWPAETPPSILKPQFKIPGVLPLVGMPVAEAEEICKGVTMGDLHANCVFDVATTGDKGFAKAYLLQQDLRLHGSTVQISGDKEGTRSGEPLVVTAIVLPMTSGRPTPMGSVTFLVDGVAAGPSVKMDEKGRARLTLDRLDAGEHKIRAAYTSDAGEDSYHISSSPNLLHTVGRHDHYQHQREDQLMDHKMEVPAGQGEKKTEVTLDVKTARRILAFVNAANRPEDLMRAPQILTHLHVEYRKPAFPERHPTEHDERRHHHEIADEKLAISILKRRNENPIYGVVRFADLLEIDRIHELLPRWWYFFSRASKGEWTGPFDLPAGSFDRPVHAALLSTGKVLFFGLPSGKDSWLWTPNAAAAGTVAATTNKPTDSLFCAGHSFLSDGRLLVVGGGGDGTGPRHNHGWIFDPTPGVEAWTRTAGNGTPGNGDMAFYRWYPTLVTMGDEPGRVLVVSGDDTSGTDVRQMEMYMESSDRFELVWGPAGVGDTSAEHSFPQIYPSMHLLPGGEVFYTPTGWHSGGCSGAADFPAAKPSGFFEFLSTSVPVKASWTNIGTQDAAAEDAIDRVKGMAVVLVQPSYPFVQAMVVGGGKDPESATTFQMINLSTIVPKWGPPVTLPDGLSRVNVNLVALPDGTVFVSGGQPLAGTPANGGACWIYDPVAMTWQQCDSVANKRGYHSVALLLPDGRVVTAGNECPADDSYEVFSPPYLFASDGTLAPRPEITILPAQVHHGHQFAIQTPSPSTVAKVVLVRPMAVTHQTDSEQRVLQLPFLATGPTEVTATAPNGWHPHALAPRGWYMVFLVDTQGVPSEGKFIHLH